MVDIFSKFTWVEPVEDKTTSVVVKAISLALHNMPNHNPKYIYTDMEGAFISGEAQKLFRDNNITHLLSLNHAPYAERQIRTIKDMIYKRLERFSLTSRNLSWKDVLPQVRQTFYYNMVSNVTKLTPAAAGDPANRDYVLMNLELTRKTTHRDPPIKVGDKVRIYKKKETFDKERVPVWSPEVYTVTEVVEYQMNLHKRESQLPQKLYKVNGEKNPLQRAHLLLVSSA